MDPRIPATQPNFCRLIRLVTASDPHRQAGRTWVVAALAAILLGTLSPAPNWPDLRVRVVTSLYPTTAAAWVDILANVAFYAPLGFALAMRGVRPRRACAAGAALSLGTELLQFVIPGRDPRASDVVANTLGASLGALAASTPVGLMTGRFLTAGQHLLLSKLATERRFAAAMSTAWAVVVVGVLASSALLVHPAPTAPDYAVTGPLMDRVPGGVRIGASGHPGTFFNGLIDEVRIYAAARSIEQIRRDMQRPVAGDASPELVAGHGFDALDGLVAPDDSGHGHDAIIHGASPVGHGRYGGALSFDGRTSELVISGDPELDLRSAMTLEAWVFPLDQRAQEPVVIAHDGDSYHLSGAQISGRFRPTAGGVFGGANDEARVPDPIPSDTWTHVAATYDSETISVYLDGSLARSKRRWSSHRLRTISLNGAGLSAGRVIDPEPLRAALMRPLHLNVSVACGPPRTESAPVFRVVAPGNTTLLGLDVSGEDLLVHWMSWPRRVGLASPALVVRNALSGCRAGDSIDLDLTGPLQRARATRGGIELDRLAPGLATGWGFLFHSNLMPSWLRRSCTWIWLGLLGVPIGFCTRSWGPASLAAVILITAVACLPALIDVAPLDAGQLVALAVGICLGASRRGVPFGRPLFATSASR